MPTIPTFSNRGHAETVTGVALILPTLNRVDPFPPDFIPRMQRAARRISETMREVSRAISQTAPYLRFAANDQAHVAGLAATYAVRAGLHRTLDRTSDHLFYLPGLVGALMRGDGHPDAPTGLLTRENRAQVAAAALRGYIVGHPETVTAPVTSVVWTYGARHPSTVTRAWPVPR